MKRDYLLRISEIDTKNILFKKWFENVTYREARYQAEKYMLENSMIKNKLNLNTDIVLLSSEKSGYVFQKMAWVESNLSGGNGFFKGWRYYKNTFLIEASKEPKRKTTHLFPLIFASFFAVSFTSFLLNNYEFHLMFSILNFIAGITSSMVSSLVRENFLFMAKNPKKLFLYNLEIEFPLWLSLLFTIITFAREDIILNSLEEWGVIGISVIIVLGVKFIIDYAMDRQKFYQKKTEDLYEVEVKEEDKVYKGLYLEDIKEEEPSV